MTVKNMTQHCVVTEEYLRSYHAIDANILALFGPLETTSTTTTTTTTAPTTTTKLIDAILADEDREDDYSSDYYDDYVYEDTHEEPLSWEEQQFKNAMEDKRIFDDYNDDRNDADDDDDDDDDYYDYDDDEYEGSRHSHCTFSLR